MTRQFEPGGAGSPEASSDSLGVLHRQALILIDNFGEPVPVLDPSDNPYMRTFSDFSPDAILMAGFEPGTRVRVTDEPPSEVEEDALLTIWIINEDEVLYRRRVLAMRLEQDGTFSPLPPMEEYAPRGAEHGAGRDVDLDDEEVVRILGERADEQNHDMFREDECQQLINLAQTELGSRYGQ